MPGFYLPAYRLPPTANCLLPTANRQPPTANCQLPTANRNQESGNWDGDKHQPPTEKTKPLFLKGKKDEN